MQAERDHPPGLDSEKSRNYWGSMISISIEWNERIFYKNGRHYRVAPGMDGTLCTIMFGKRGKRTTTFFEDFRTFSPMILKYQMDVTQH